MILTIGRHGKGVRGPTQARKEAIPLLGLIRDGKDPAVERAEDKAAPTLAELAQRYMSEYAERQKKPRSVEEDRRLLRHGQNKGDTETNGQTCRYAPEHSAGRDISSRCAQGAAK